MEKDLKDLFLKDLCARLPYNVICQVEFKEDGKYNSKVMLLSGIFTDEAYFTTKGGSIYSNEYKPYLFPLSSMTKEQEKEFNQLLELELKAISDEIDHTQVTAFEIDFYNKHHFDWRGLISIGLALDATGLNIY